MKTIEDYILLRKRKDKVDEFDFNHHSENMRKIIKYVCIRLIIQYSEQVIRISHVNNLFEKLE